MSTQTPQVITRYFDADARRDTDAIVALFTDDAVVIDEGETMHGTGAIRAWREGPVARYEYTTQVFETRRTGDVDYLVTGRLDGNFPGGTVELTWRFTLERDRISRLQID